MGDAYGRLATGLQTALVRTCVATYATANMGCSMLRHSLPIRLIIGVSVLCVPLLLACPREWHFWITGFDTGSRPLICASTRPHCEGRGLWLSHFSVVEVPPPSSGKAGTVVWSIVPESDRSSLHEFVYGIAPAGWLERSAAETLRPNVVYETGGYQFRLVGQAPSLRAEVAPIGELPP
jgi:hypothetical protein